MGLAHSFTKRHRAKPKEFSLDAFVVDLVKGMAEATVDSVIKERRWTLNAPRCLGGDVGVTNGFSRNPSSSSPPPSPQAKSAAASRQHGVIAGDAVAKCSSPDLKVLSSKDEFFRSAFLSVDQQGANDAKKVDYSQDQADSSEDSSRSTLESTNSTTSSSPLEDSTNTDVTSTPARSPEEDVIGLIANTASRTAPLFQEALHFFWDLRTSSERGTYEKALKDATYPPRFTADCIEDEDITIFKTMEKIGFVNRALMFDLLRELLLQIYDGEDADIRNNRQPFVNSARFRLWLGVKRPDKLDKLESIVRPKIERELVVCLTAPAVDEAVVPPPRPCVVHDISRLPRLTQWTLQRKDWLDQILELEMRADEPTWLNYKAYEKEVVDTFVEKILLETFDAAYERCFTGMTNGTVGMRAKMAKRQSTSPCKGLSERTGVQTSIDTSHTR